jgi:hypothetical protein
VFGIARKDREGQGGAARTDIELTPSQARIRDKLGARVGPAEGCTRGEVYLYKREADGTTRILVGPDGTLLERTAWDRPAG